ncbi:hypothetical protein [Polyangium sorediatum]|uniref:Uncharacterized protein n=1 Tax=Polyangium sorediatum TaxID=889274 RepID=A0ABT6P3D5_9BACT|nr:hypothetical protein [Polyangium sorediatum]MDI1435031.1 hypothetical protein [Polyangium sorediatum]
MISLDQALDRLLHHRSYREAFFEGRVEELDVSEGDLRALQSIDPEQLRRTAERVRVAVVQRKHRGSGGLLTIYARTLDAWRATHPEDHELDALMSSFLESPAFEAYRAYSHAGPGVCLEEAFFRFCDARGIGDGAILESEFLTAMMKALVMSPLPDFTLPGEIRVVPEGFFAVGERAGPTLYAAARGKLVLGAITPFLAELLLSAEDPVEIARKHHVATPVLQASLAQLAQLGLGR